MKRLIIATVLSLGTLALAPFAANAQMAQSTDQMQMPNGNTRTVTRTEGPGGTSATRTVDRADGTRTVIRRQTDNMGNTRVVRHDRGSSVRSVCRTHWQHGRRIRHCVKRYR